MARKSIHRFVRRQPIYRGKNLRMIPDYESHYRKLRELYVRATPNQRIMVARDRMAHSDGLPNLLITAVSATEALARALAINIKVRSGQSANGAYRKLRNMGPIELLEKVVFPARGVEITKLIGPTRWEEFKWAIRYRNLLLHEGTYLAQMFGNPLLRTTQAVFAKLEMIS